MRSWGVSPTICRHGIIFFLNIEVLFRPHEKVIKTTLQLTKYKWDWQWKIFTSTFVRGIADTFVILSFSWWRFFQGCSQRGTGLEPPVRRPAPLEHPPPHETTLCTGVYGEPLFFITVNCIFIGLLVNTGVKPATAHLVRTYAPKPSLPHFEKYSYAPVLVYTF